MSEIGIDISNHFSKSVEEFYGTGFDYVVRGCASDCKRKEKGKLRILRRVRDEIKKWVFEVFGKGHY